MRSFLLGLVMALGFPAFASDPGDSLLIIEQLKRIDSIESSLHYKTGQVVIKDGLATINLKPGYKFLDAAESRYILEDVWGNLKGQTALGMILPDSVGASYADYAFIIEYEAIGYVKDGDADKINYDDLLKELKDDAVKSNEERRKMGLKTMDLVGWAAHPYYDKDRKLLHWAKEFRVEDVEENTLNYDIRILGRKGVLTLQAISSVNHLPQVKSSIDPILAMVSFNKGNQYADFDSNTDEVAAWTIGGLVAGKVLAKAGFFALVLKNIKLILIGLAAAGGAIWRFIRGRRKEDEEVVYEPAPSQDGQSG